MPDVLAPNLPYAYPYAPNTGQPNVQVWIGPGYPVIPVRDTWITAQRAGTATPTS